MAALLVRNLEEEVVLALKRRAEAHGRSVEEEHRRILRRVLAPKRPKRTFAEHLLAIPRLTDEEAEGFGERRKAVTPRPIPFVDDEE